MLDNPASPTLDQDPASDQTERSPDFTVSADEHPAGGTDPDRFDWHEVWHPIAYVRDLDPNQLTTVTLLDQNLVIWWERTSQSWRVFEDACPHRLAPLSEGRVAEDGLLECPYHGWAFSGTGDCQRIPQQRDTTAAESSSRACVASLPTAIRQGLLFVYPGTPSNAEKTRIPIVDPLDESPDEWVCLDTVRDLPYDALTLLENVIDSSHIPYTHHKTVGDRANASPVDLEVVESGRQGFRGRWEEGPRRGTLGSQTTIFVAPALMWHDLTSKQFGRTMTVVYATPISKGKSRLFARFPFKFSSKLPEFFIKLTPRWYSHISQNAILEDDQIFLHLQERALEQSGGRDQFTKAFYLPTAADAFVAELCNWVNTYHADPFPDASLPPAFSTAQLLDRYHSHVEQCASCRGALNNIQRIRRGAAFLGIGAGVVSPLLISLMDGTITSLLTASLAIAAGLWFGLGRLERRFYDGREIPPRNHA